MTPQERNNLLLEIYDYQVTQGHTRGGSKNRRDVGEENWAKELAIVEYWEQKGLVDKTIVSGFVELKLTSNGINYVERELI